MLRKTPYSFGRTVPLAHAEAVTLIKEALAEQGFGILTEIDVAAKFKEKLGIDYPAYRILGACNPKMAHRALGIEADLGVMLPCNVIVFVDASGTTNVMAMDPAQAMKILGNPAIEAVAQEVRSLIALALEKLP
ncbi:MAG TPA: DUF302 domain-containing protein [Malonomonas sp.]